jgi:hypothetical protein
VSTCCRPTRSTDCPHGHAVLLRASAKGKTWVEEVAPSCCPLCPEGAVLQSYEQHAHPKHGEPKKEATVAFKVKTVFVMVLEGTEVLARDCVEGVFEELPLATHRAQELEDQHAKEHERAARPVVWVKDGELRRWVIDDSSAELFLTETVLRRGGFGTET